MIFFKHLRSLDFEHSRKELLYSLSRPPQDQSFQADFLFPLFLTLLLLISACFTEQGCVMEKQGIILFCNNINKSMSELMNFQVQLPRRRLKMDLLNRRFAKLGFTRLQSLKRQSLPVVENGSIFKRYKTERSEDKQKYVNEFQEFNYEDSQSSIGSMKLKRQIQPLCIYKKPKIKEKVCSYRTKLLPKVREGGGETECKDNVGKEEESIGTTNQSVNSFSGEELFTFYPNRKTIKH